MNRTVVFSVLFLLVVLSQLAHSEVSIATCSIQGILQVGEKFNSSDPSDSHALPSSVVRVYYLQLPLPVFLQLKAQGIILAENQAEECERYSQMVDIGWPSNDQTYNPFELNKKVGKKIKVTGKLYSPYRAFFQYLSPLSMNATKVEVLENFETESW